MRRAEQTGFFLYFDMELMRAIFLWRCLRNLFVVVKSAPRRNGHRKNGQHHNGEHSENMCAFLSQFDSKPKQITIIIYI